MTHSPQPPPQAHMNHYGHYLSNRSVKFTGLVPGLSGSSLLNNMLVVAGLWPQVWCKPPLPPNMTACTSHLLDMS